MKSPSSSLDMETIPRAASQLREFLRGVVGSRKHVVFLGIVIITLVLCVLSPTRRVGDGAEYLTMAHAFATGHGPVLSPSQLRANTEYLDSVGDGFKGVDLQIPKLQNKSGGQNFPHFWMYSLLASPFVAMSSVLGVSPNWGFEILNLGMFLVAAWLALSRLGSAGTLFLFLGPALWWIDKAHTEEFTFSLLSIAFLLVGTRPLVSVLCLALASTQNPPIAFLIPMFLALAIARERTLLRSRRLWLAVACAGILSSLHPLFYEWQLGVYTPQAALGVVTIHSPSLARYVAPVTDLNIGLVPRFPFIGLAVIVLGLVIVRQGWRRMINPELIVAVIAGIFLLWSFAQTEQIQSGGTHSIDRYALWLVPLMIPVITLARRDRFLFPRVMIPIALCSSLFSMVAFAPQRPEDYLHPSLVASVVWDHAPWLDNPVAIIFYERVSHQDAYFAAPAATSNCSKVLIVGGVVPSGCRISQHLPAFCKLKAPSACYANRFGHRYVFAKAPL